ncbi:MAG TPA: DUF1592 domain-containing protein, partial [Verrucomicrobiae bacterium]|nr:DUF1592 domain-containing protein [Verrucomicrobiae bacterium]
MKKSRTFGFATMTMSLVVFAWALDLNCPAQSASDTNFTLLQSDARKSFKEVVTPFVETYCSRCHGQDRQKGGINFGPALKNPGETASGKRWKQAVAIVKSHDMPPENATKQPTDEERQKFLNGIGKLKFLSAKDPGPFVIRRLTKVEYGNTLHDLLGVEPAVADELPDEVFGEGFLNTISPIQSEQYLAIANEALAQSLATGARLTKAQKLLSGQPPRRGADERLAARKVARALARLAYRRPASEAELDILLRVFDLARESKLAYPEALRLMLKAILVSPQFLFITPAVEADPGHPIVALDDYQLASRLSYLLWATMPDAELAALADRGQLHEPAVLKTQVKRMLYDPRSRALFDGFGAQWLGVGNLKSKTFDAIKFPQMTSAMRSAMYNEVRLFFESIVRENRGVGSLVDCDYTFLNGTLAPLYGLGKKVAGTQWRKVALAD